MNLMKEKTARSNIIIAIISGVLIMMVISGILICITPQLVLNGLVTKNSTYLFVMLTLLISTLLGSLVAGLIVHYKKWMVMIGCSGIYYLVLLCCGMLFFDSEPSRLVVGIIVVGFGTLSSIMISNLKRKTTVKRRRHR